MRQRLAIDADLWETARQYAARQLEIMRVELTAERFDKLVYDLACYPQRVRNLQRKIAKTRAAQQET